MSTRVDVLVYALGADQAYSSTLVTDLLAGPLWPRHLVTAAPTTLDEVEATVDVVLDGARHRLSQ